MRQLFIHNYSSYTFCGNYSRAETIQGRKLLIVRRFLLRKLFKGGNYSRAETIRGNTVCKYVNIHLVQNSVNATFSQSQKLHYMRTLCSCFPHNFEWIISIARMMQEQPSKRTNPVNDTILWNDIGSKGSSIHFKVFSLGIHFFFSLYKAPVCLSLLKA